MTRVLSRERVVHIRIGEDSSQPWRGRGPLQVAQTSAAVAAKIEQRLSEEANSPTGSLIPVPSTQNTEKLAGDIRGLKGRVAMVDSTSGGWDQGRGTAPGGGNADWRLTRVGMAPATGIDGLRNSTAGHLLAACGVPVALLGDADGTNLRESTRQMLHTTLTPLGRIALDELRFKLDRPDLTFDWNPLFAADLTGRARAFQSLVGGGMPVDQAAGLSGLLIED